MDLGYEAQSQSKHVLQMALKIRTDVQIEPHKLWPEQIPSSIVWPNK